MITTAEEYIQHLSEIQDANAPSIAILLPSSERIYNVDLNTRMVETPDFLSVEKDHRAECIYFIVDRFYDNVDLSTMICVIQYVNAGGEQRVYAVPYYDISTFFDNEHPKILFPWAIGGEATKYAGEINFSIRFYKLSEGIDNDPNAARIMLYNLNTRPSKSKILYGLSVSDQEVYDYLGSIEDTINQRIALLDDLYWLDLT